MSSLNDRPPRRSLPVGPSARSRGERHSQILLGALGKSSMAKGSAELSEFAPTKIRADDRRWRSKTLSSSDKLQALGNVYARSPAQMSKFGSPRPHGGTRTATREQALQSQPSLGGVLPL